MQEILNKIGVDIELLNKEPLHTREQTLEILGISPKTLWKYEREKLIKGTRFKSKKYYSTNSILDCIKIQFGIGNQVEWNNIFD